MSLSLKRFFLFEWFPRAPGLYFTDEGKFARTMAQQYRRRVPVPRQFGTHYLDATRKDREFLDIYDPHGKIAMLKGGVGCIRLRPKLLDGGMALFFFASSTGVADEGFPVAISNQLYQRYIDRVIETGALRCTLRGKLQFPPEPSVELYREYRGVPQLYLLVEELILDDDQSRENLLVSAGISFLSSFEGAERMYASYATFEAGVRGSVEEVVDWLQEVYVQGLYSGRVITDFDEQMTHFANATFSLRNIMMDKRVDQGQAQMVVQKLHLDPGASDRLFAGLAKVQTIQIGRLVMEGNKTVNIGNGATISAPVVIADSIQERCNVLHQSETSPELKSLLDRLLKAVAKASQEAPSTGAQNAARDARYLVDEVIAKEPRPGEGLRLGERIKDWARTIGEVGKPVIELVTALLPMLSH